MKWYSEEHGRLLKAWEASADDRLQADSTFTLSPSQDYLISATVGEVIDLKTGEIGTYPELAEMIKQDLLDYGWDKLTFKEVCEVYGAYLREMMSDLSHDFSEMEIVFIQNQLGVMDEAYLHSELEIPKPRVLEPTY